MKVFVWKRVDDCGSDMYHSEGGVVVFADSEERARELAPCIAPREKPDEVRDVVSGGELVFIMRDAGCC
jgi:hypothetical protein